MPSRTARRASALAVGLTLLTAGAALAHPSFDPNQVPAGEAVETTLVIPHGCAPGGGMPGEDGGNPTTLVELQLTDAIAAFAARDVAGWDLSRDGDVVTWRDAGGATTDPLELPVSLTITGAAEDELYLSVYQQCEAGGEFRWIGTPDREADHPAVKLTLTSGAVGTEEVADDDLAEVGGTASETANATGDPSSETEHDGATETPSDVTTGDPDGEDGGSGFPGAALGAAVLATLVATGGVLAVRRRDAS